MIRNEAEYRESRARLEDFRHQLERLEQELALRGLDAYSIEVAVAPLKSITDQLRWDLGLYERLRDGDASAIPSFPPEDRGKSLVCLRLVKGWSQRQLAEALGVTEAQVSRDERNEYHGISLERYSRILDVMGFQDEGRLIPKASARIIPFPRTQVIRTAASFTPPESLRIRSREAQ